MFLFTSFTIYFIMSLKVPIHTLTDEQRQACEEIVNIQHKNKVIEPYKISNNNLYLPFGFAVEKLNLNRPKRTNEIFNAKFKGKLRSEQQEVKQNAIKFLNRNGCVLISLYCGGGKCLGKNTQVLMYNGSVKMVQDIVIGDQIMGDDSKPRNVLSLARGHEQMYKITSAEGDTFTCNESHILSLKDDNDNVVDISLKEYIKLPNNIQKQMKYYKTSVDFNEKNITIDPYVLGVWLGDKTLLEPFMSKEKNYLLNQLQNYGLLKKSYIPFDFKCNTKKIRLRLLAGILDTIGFYSSYFYSIEHCNYDLINDILYTCRSLGFYCYAHEKSCECYLLKIYGDNIDEIPVLEHKPNWLKSIYKNNLSMDFTIEPIKETEYYGFEIDGNRRFLLGDFTVTHNTITSINLACNIKMKTLVVVNKIVLIKQWKESIEKFSSGKIQILDSKSEFDNECDFYIMNGVNIPKMGHTFFNKIGLLLVDECHTIMAEQISYLMNYIQPRYLIGLSATPYRNDGLNILLDLYFGSNKIHKPLHHPHKVFLVYTEFSPKMETTINGKVDYNSILDSISLSEQRNEIIVNIVKNHPTRIFLILVKRIVQGEYLNKRLLEENEYVDTLLGNKQTFDKNARILIGTASKVGTGFDHKKLDSLILGAPIKDYYIQVMGRIMRTKDNTPIVFDLVDKNPILLKHYKLRKETYNETGGKIFPYSI